MCSQGRNGDADMENRRVHTEAEVWMNRESHTDAHTRPRVNGGLVGGRRAV